MSRRRLALATAAAATGLLVIRLRPDAPGEDADVAPDWEPHVCARLASWQPAPPRTRVTTLTARLWAGPMTLAGLAVGLASGARPRLRDGVVLFAEARGPAGAMLRGRGFTAAALGHVVVARGEPSASLLAHELVHVRQAERLGPLFAPVYLGLLAVYGYARHPLERAARCATSTPVPRSPTD